MEAELSATRDAELPVADLAGLNTQLTSTTSQERQALPGAATPPGRSRGRARKICRTLYTRRTEENGQPMTRRDPADPRGAVAAPIAMRARSPES
jgi:hypothetical protein